MTPARRAAAAVVALIALTVAGTAGAAAPSPDAHDRTLAAQLNAKVTTFRQISKGASQSDTSLNKCAAFKNDPKQALAAVFLLIPVFLTEVVNDYGQQVGELRDTMAAMHPDSPLFRQWLAAEGRAVSLLLKFDNHGKRVDVCAAAKVLLDKHSTDADVYRVIGIHTNLIGELFGSTANQTVSKLNAPMRAFFVAAGLSPADAKTLTS